MFKAALSDKYEQRKEMTVFMANFNYFLIGFKNYSVGALTQYLQNNSK